MADAKTNKFNVAAPQKTKAPASNKVDKKLTKAAPVKNATLTNVPEIDSLYKNFKTRLPVATKYGVSIDKLEAAQRKANLIHELVFAINDDPNGMGLPHKSWVALMTHAYNKYLKENGPIVDASPSVLESIQDYIEDLIGSKENYILPKQSEAETIVMYLNELRTFGVAIDEVNSELSGEAIRTILESLEESIRNYRTSPHNPKSKEFNTGNTYGLAVQSFVRLGFGAKDSHFMAEGLFSKINWKPI